MVTVDWGAVMRVEQEYQDRISALTSERDSLRKRVEELESMLAKDEINTLVFEVSENSDRVLAWLPLNEHASTFLLDNESVEYLEFNAADFIGCRATIIFSTNQPAPHDGEEG